MTDVRVHDARGVVHLHNIHSTNKFKCRMSIYIPGMHKGVVRTTRPLTCFWCIVGKRFK